MAAVPTDRELALRSSALCPEFLHFSAKDTAQVSAPRPGSVEHREPRLLTGPVAAVTAPVLTLELPRKHPSVRGCLSDLLLLCHQQQQPSPRALSAAPTALETRSIRRFAMAPVKRAAHPLFWSGNLRFCVTSRRNKDCFVELRDCSTWWL